ncbi:MAG: hypothetical protein BWY59_00007 [Verrucomicrobia bacterium ADurb.Bin345]|nr:MAG: hypothetical protein BWY59_00007 [Verrucomicrobia bacterium ADurb.Bin345]
MATIRELLDRYAPSSYRDNGLRWEAKASAYATEIVAGLQVGQTPALLELENDLGLTTPPCLLVDHHNKRASTG